VQEYKKAQRELTSMIEKNKKAQPYEQVYMKLVKAYVLKLSSKLQECMKEVDDVCKGLVEHKITDKSLIDKAELLFREIGCFERMEEVLEALYKVNPKDPNVAHYLFSAYLQSNSFFKMSGMASTIEKQMGEKKYGLY